MRKLIAFIPHLFTLGNLFCGCLAIIFAFQNKLEWSFLMIISGAFLDFFDGFFARILKVQGELGKQLDSLADLITFGVAPGMMMFVFIDLLADFSGISCYINEYMMNGDPIISGKKTDCVFDYTLLSFHHLSYFAMMIPLFSAFRLAKFNIDSRQSYGFLGLPTPANAIFLSSVILTFLLVTNMTSFSLSKGISGSDINSITYTDHLDPIFNHGAFFQIIYNPYSLIVISFITSLLLVSEIPLFALKFKNFSWGDNKVRYIFLALSAAMLIIFQLFAIPFIIILYIIISVINNIFNRRKSTLST